METMVQLAVTLEKLRDVRSDELWTMMLFGTISHTVIWTYIENIRCRELCRFVVTTHVPVVMFIVRTLPSITEGVIFNTARVLLLVTSVLLVVRLVKAIIHIKDLSALPHPKGLALSQKERVHLAMYAKRT
uniref:Uncharacterized protein n=1 Tax=Branchiostoma floridae TaxID=7739 RepID=C3Y666_BRAFL|eukprot:XP_002608453.1 hypothetical protein BRAFLDRAFT_96589 [Branchiostoma floridae]